MLDPAELLAIQGKILHLHLKERTDLLLLLELARILLMRSTLTLLDTMWLLSLLSTMEFQVEATDQTSTQSPGLIQELLVDAIRRMETFVAFSMESRLMTLVQLFQLFQDKVLKVTPQLVLLWRLLRLTREIQRRLLQIQQLILRWVLISSTNWILYERIQRRTQRQFQHQPKQWRLLTRLRQLGLGQIL